ncbi:uncharacterized protein LOC113295371 [Papaver somniferum]|uniref:uncharacterized protein LOC113295371 n=1 Tax=Papaver somniferum TaxID=3469 RepID=UPI000E6F64E9|nr:uncharacterized protein LOC113295371 [Papaver somniferum]
MSQAQLQSDPLNQDLASRERDYVYEYVRLAKFEESAVNQKSRIQWLNLGDTNSSFFHNSLKVRISKNNILALYNNVNEKLEEDQDIAKEFVDFYINLFGEKNGVTSVDPFIDINFGACIQQDDVEYLVKQLTREEIVEALDTIGSSKSPGPYGLSGHFFKACWSIVGDDFVSAVKNFFDKSKLLKEVNSTFITLVAKKENPTIVTNFRPISCCNVVYKCITKILSLRMKKVLSGLISSNQSDFIYGRAIQDNIMVAHEIVRNYDRKRGSPRCALKIDLKKAYDTVSWDAIFYVLKNMGFPDDFIE